MSNTKKIKSQRRNRRNYYKRLRASVRQALGGGHSYLVYPERYNKRPEKNYVE